MKLNFTKYSFLILTLLLFLTGCSGSRYNVAHSQYLRKRYVNAISNYDGFLIKEKNGAKKTLAELERSECYYQLGSEAYKKGDRPLAIRYLFLANTAKSDELLGECYLSLASNAYQQGKIDISMQYYSMITDNFRFSKLIPEVLFSKLKIFLNDYHDKENAWYVYTLLVDNFPNGSYTKQAEPFINQFLEGFITNILAEGDSVSYDLRLEQLFYLSQYPSAFNKQIEKEIAKQYLDLAEFQVSKAKYISAERTFRIVVKYDVSFEVHIRNRLIAICSLFIEKGNQLLADRDIEHAILHFEKTFDIIPDYPEAVAAIIRAEEKRVRIEKANAIVVQALAAEAQEDYTLALKLYQNANNVDPLPEYRTKAFEMESRIRIEKDPIGFAREIITSHLNGLIISRINNLENQMIAEFGAFVESSGWIIVKSIGDAKYEVRYDINSPTDSYYFVWLANLLDRTVQPLNNSSEELVK